MLPLSPDAIAPATLRPLKRSEYHQLVEMGAFEDEAVELLYGQLVAMSPQGGPHTYALTQLLELLLPVLLGRAKVRSQAPVAASDDSEPEPDLAVVPPGDYLDERPKRCHLVVEIAQSSRTQDLGIKARLYAEMGVPDYWVIDLVDDVIVVHRSPSEGRYGDVRPVGRGADVALLAFPDVVVRVDDVLPPPR